MTTASSRSRPITDFIAAQSERFAGSAKPRHRKRRTLLDCGGRRGPRRRTARMREHAHPSSLSCVTPRRWTQNGHIRNDTRDVSRRIFIALKARSSRRNCVASDLACTRVTRSKMVRRRSTVRVRQRASGFFLPSRCSSCLGRRCPRGAASTKRPPASTVAVVPRSARRARGSRDRVRRVRGDGSAGRSSSGWRHVPGQYGLLRRTFRPSWITG
jgi:hypothetical protein